MRILTLNCNGIRSACTKGLFHWLPSQQADVVCLQETKAQVHQLDHPDFRHPRRPRGRELARKGIAASESELSTNPRARSARLRVLDGADRDIAHAAQAMREEAEHGALAGAGLSGDEDVAALDEGVGGAGDEVDDAGCAMQRLDGDVGAERMELEAEDGLHARVHSVTAFFDGAGRSSGM